ncbi:MAG: AAA family ATPase, partial [Myxococcota bacterium]
MNTRAHIVNPGGPVPRGVSDFTQLVQGGHCFVDKTLFIKEILDGGDAVTLIIRPRRFGKTTLCWRAKTSARANMNFHLMLADISNAQSHRRFLELFRS